MKLFSQISLRLSKFFFLVFFVFKLDKIFVHYHYKARPVKANCTVFKFFPNLSLSFSKFGKTYFARSFLFSFNLNSEIEPKTYSCNRYLRRYWKINGYIFELKAFKSRKVLIFLKSSKTLHCTLKLWKIHALFAFFLVYLMMIEIQLSWSMGLLLISYFLPFFSKIHEC